MNGRLQRRTFLRAAPAAAALLPAWAQPARGMRPVPPADREAVQVGAGTQDGATTGSSGPQKEGSSAGSAAGTLSGTQPGNSGGGAGAGRKR